jgi:hypothetical protein
MVLGIFVFYENLHQAVTQLSHFLGAIPREALGVLPTVILATSRVLQACGADPSRSLQVCVLHMWACSWPLLLVIVGTVLSRDCSTDNVDALLKRDCGLVDLTTGRSTSE